MQHVLDIALSIDFQGYEGADGISFFDFFPFGVSFMGHRCRKFLYIFVLFFVIGVSWSVGEVK